MNRFFATLAMACAAGIPATTQAQTPAASPVTLVLMGGAAMPMGDLDDFADMGFILGAGAEFGVSALPFGLRAELNYARFGEFDFSSPDGNATFRQSNFGAAINAIFGPSVPAATIRPYFIAGLGFYNSKFEADVEGGGFDVAGSVDQGGLGLNGGAGVRFQFVGFSSFLEARYVHLFNGTPDFEAEEEEWKAASYIPIVFGISIGG